MDLCVLTNRYQSEKIFNRRCISGVSFKCQPSTGLRNPFWRISGALWYASCGGAVSFWSGQLLSASGQPRVSRSTVRRPCVSPSGSTGLISSAPFRRVQLLQLSGNGGFRSVSAVHRTCSAVRHDPGHSPDPNRAVESPGQPHPHPHPQP